MTLRCKIIDPENWMLEEYGIKIGLIYTLKITNTISTISVSAYSRDRCSFYCDFNTIRELDDHMSNWQIINYIFKNRIEEKEIQSLIISKMRNNKIDNILR